MADLWQIATSVSTELAVQACLVTREQIYDYFDDGTVSRGRKYYEEKRVLDTGWSPAKDGADLSGEVRGTRKYGVMVELRFGKKGNPIQRTDCSCPVGYNCKHAVALLLDYIAYKEEQQRLDGLGRSVRLWLAELKDAAEAVCLANEGSSSSTDKCVLYIIDQRMDRNLGRLSIRPHTATRKKSGEFGATQSHYFGDLARSRAQFIQPCDAKLLHMYAMNTSFHWHSEQLPDEPAVVELLISMTLATGRCHWQHPKNPPLKRGPSRTGSIGWRLTDENAHIPELKMEGEGLLPLFSAFPTYIDLQNWEVGPLNLNVPWKIADSFLAAPAIKTAELEQVTEFLQPLRGLAKLPMPPSSFQIIKLSGTPKPLLTLHTIKQAHGYAFPQPQHFAVLRFEYDGIEVKGRNPSPQIRTREGDKVTCIERDLDQERRIISELLKTGLMKHESRALQFTEDELLFKAGELNREIDWLSWLERDFDVLPDCEPLVEFDLGFGLHRSNSISTAMRFTRTADWWFNLNLGINVDGKNISLLPILKRCFDQFNGRLPSEAIERMSVNGTFYAKLPDGSYVGVPVDQVKDIYNTLVEMFLKMGISDAELENYTFPANEVLKLKNAPSFSAATILGDEEGTKFLDRLKSFSSLDDFNEPTNFKTQLRPYQKHGCAWLQFLSDYRLGGILADDMGLGKTVQVLAHLLSEKESGRAIGPSLVICPTSVGPNWVAECARHSPSLRTALLTSGDELMAIEELLDKDVLITSYGLMMRHAKETLSKYSWHAVVLDEAQFIKNYKTKMALAAGYLKAHHRLCLTGTPIENHLGELWSQLNFAMPGLLGDTKEFNKNFRIPIEKSNDKEARDRLVSRVKSFVLRRTKDQVLTELPAKTVIIKTIELEGGQRELYEVVRLAAYQRIREEIAARGLHRSQITILAELMKLRQVCCDPRLPKLDSPYKSAPSAKLQALMEMIEKLHEDGRKILIFSQFTSMLALIEAELKILGIEYVILKGETKDRTTPVKRFQKGEVSLFLLSLKAGGTGLNLTAADTVIHYDLWWNPAVESQATDRAHRIGQTKPVFVYKLVGRGTIEQRMLELQAKKNRLVQAILNDDASMLSKFNEADLNALFEPIDVEYSIR